MSRGLALLPTLVFVAACAHAPGGQDFDSVDYPYQGERTFWGQRAQCKLRIAELSTQTSTKTAVLLLHPWALNMKIWADVAPELSRSRPVLLLDLPGHGKSAKFSSNFPIERLAAAGFDAMDAAGYRSVVVIGNSLGGATALAMAKLDPSRVESLVLVAAPGALPIAQPIQQTVNNAATAEACEAFNGWLWKLGHRVVMRTESKLAEAISRDLKLVRRGPQWKAWCGSTMKILSEVVAYQAPLESIETPALVVRGDADLTISEANSRTMAERLPNARFRELPGCGHLPQLECPEQLLHTVADFLVQTAKTP